MWKLLNWGRHWNLLQLNKNTWKLVMLDIAIVKLSFYLIIFIICQTQYNLFCHVMSCDVWCITGCCVANESTHKRVIFYTIGEYILLALASGLQVVYIRRLFSKSVAYNRVWALNQSIVSYLSSYIYCYRLELGNIYVIYRV